MTVEQLGREITSAELTEWLAFEQEYGLPDAFFAAGVVAPASANAFGGKTRASDFIPYYAAEASDRKRAKGRMSSAEMLANFDKHTGSRKGL
jgi:hypothetical protein